MKEKIINYIETLEAKAYQSDDYFKQRNELYISNQEKDKEIERLNNIIKGLDNTIENLEEVVEHKENIIKEVREYILQHCEIIRDEEKNTDMVGRVEGISLLEILDKKEVN